MPVSIHRHGNRYSVETPNQVHAKSTTKEKAKAQERLLNAVDHSDWRPTHHESVGAFVDNLLEGKWLDTLAADAVSSPEFGRETPAPEEHETREVVTFDDIEDQVEAGVECAKSGDAEGAIRYFNTILGLTRQLLKLHGI